MRRLLPIVLLVVVIALIVHMLSINEIRGSKMAELSLVLSLDKMKYQPNEPIRASITLKNASNEDIVVRKRMIPSLSYAPKEVKEVTFIINGPSGEVNPSFRIQASPLTTDDFIVLPPGEMVVNTFDIQKIYYLTDLGAYSMFAVYQNIMDTDSFPKEVWKGEITSATVFFEIIP